MGGYSRPLCSSELLFSDMAGNMDYCHRNHKESYFAVYRTKVRMSVSVGPYNRCGYTADCSQKKRPPKDTRSGVTVLCKTREPVAGPVVQGYMVKRKSRKNDSQYNMKPYRPYISAGSRFKLYSVCQHQ